jgi:N-acetylneuraminate lyase
MHSNGSLHLELIEEYYHLLKSNGVTGAFICGSTGEGVSLTHTEKRAVAQAWANATLGDPDFKVMLFWAVQVLPIVKSWRYMLKN